jgi:DNA-binding NarL/FixJ family response regulator
MTGSAAGPLEPAMDPFCPSASWTAWWSASGFLLKDTQPADLLQALRVVMHGDAMMSPAVTRRLISEFAARPPDAVAAAGMETLTTHVSRAMIKLGARDRAQLVVFAYQTALVTPRTAGQAMSSAETRRLIR